MHLLVKRNFDVIKMHGTIKKKRNILKATAGTIVGDILQVLLGTASLLKSGIFMNRGRF